MFDFILNEILFHQLNDEQYFVREKATKALIKREAIEFILNKDKLPPETKIRCDKIIRQVFLSHPIENYKGNWQKFVEEDISSIKDEPYKHIIYAIIFAARYNDPDFAAMHCRLPFKLDDTSETIDFDVVANLWRNMFKHVSQNGAYLSVIDEIKINPTGLSGFVLPQDKIELEKGDSLISIKFKNGNNMHIFIVINKFGDVWRIKYAKSW